MDELRTWDATETAERIRVGDVSATEVVDAAIERAHRLDPVLNGIVSPTYAAARAAASRHLTGSLAGVPTAIKDMVGIAGVPLTYGSRAWVGHRARHTEAPALQHLGTGLVSIGTTAMSEFGLSPMCEPLGRPATRNPWALEHSTGGSSGGSAALVAGGVVPIALAADGGGSIRIPAASCGLVGLKPSRGRMTGFGELDRSPIVVGVHGVVARSVRDVAAYHAEAERVAASPAGLPPIGDVTGPGRKRLRIGVSTDTPNGALVDREVAAAVERTAALLADAGHTVVPYAFPDVSAFEEDFTLYFCVLAAGTVMIGRKQLGRSFDPALLDPWTRRMGAYARRHAARVPGAILRLKRSVQLYREQFTDLDVLLTPTTTHPAPPLGHLDPTLPFEEHRDRLRRWMAYTPLQNITGAPAIAVPAGRSSAGLPIGVMLAALPGQERRLLELAFELEEAAPWEQLAPDVLAPAAA